jgi:hypothetical protein
MRVKWKPDEKAKENTSPRGAPVGEILWEECSSQAYVVDVNGKSPPISPHWGKLCGNS